MNSKEKTFSTFSQQNKHQNHKKCQISKVQILKLDLEQLKNTDQLELLVFFQSKCKKLMRNYLKCLKRNKTFDSRKIFSQMISCLSKIFSNTQNDNYADQTSSSLGLSIEKSHKRQTNNSYFLLQLKEKQESKCVRVLSCVKSINNQEQMLADIQILSLDRKIVFTKIGPYNEQFVLEELQTTSNKFNIVLTFVDNFIDNGSPFEELQKIAVNFIRTDTMSQQQIQAQIKKNEMKMQDQSIIIAILKTIKEYQLEKRFIFEFFHSKGNNQSIIQTLTEAHLFAIYFNIKSLIVKLFQKNQLLACQAFQNTISKSLLKYTDPNYDKNSKNKLVNTHYPLKLKNAMLCQSCRRKRTYLSCQQCTNLQDKIIPLCLCCYKVFHLNKSKQYEAIEPKQQLIQVQTWKKMDLQVQADLNNSFLQLFGNNYLV